MDIALYIFALLCGAIGLLGAIIPGLPGPAISWIALLIAYFSTTPPVTMAELMIYLVITVIVTLADYLLPIYVTKWLGGSKSGIWGATIGMLVGFVAFPPLGIILCPLVGAVMGELLNNKDDVGRAFKVGFGSFFSFLLGTGLKFVLSVWILWILFVAFFPIVKDAVVGIFN